jgi:hypothetical protein
VAVNDNGVDGGHSEQGLAIVGVEKQSQTRVHTNSFGLPLSKVSATRLEVY